MWSPRAQRGGTTWIPTSGWRRIGDVAEGTPRGMPWWGVSGAAGQCGSVAAEGEHGQRDQRGGVVEAERDSGEHPDFGVGGFDQPLGEAVLERGVDAVAVFDDAAGQLDEDRDAAAPRPRDPLVEGVFAVLPLDREHMPQALFQQVRAIKPGVGFGDPGQLGGLAFGEVFGVFPQRVAGALSRRARSCPGLGGVSLAGRPRRRLGS